MGRVMEKYRPKPLEVNQLCQSSSKYVCFTDASDLVYYSHGMGEPLLGVCASLLYWPDNEGSHMSLKTGQRFRKANYFSEIPDTFQVYLNTCLMAKVDPKTNKQQVYVPQNTIVNIFNPNLQKSLSELKKSPIHFTLVKKVELISRFLEKNGIENTGVFGDLQTNILPILPFSQPDLSFLIYGEEGQNKFKEIDKKDLRKIGFPYSFKVNFVD